MKKLSILLVILWMILIFYYSSMNGTESSVQSEGLVSLFAKLIHYTGNINTLRYIIRKCAHVTEYFILGFLVINAIRYYNVKDVILLSILICIIYACTDELHQVFISGRDAKIIDMSLDALSSTLSILGYKILRK